MAELNDLHDINIPEGAKQLTEEVEKSQNMEQTHIDSVSELMDIHSQDAKSLKRCICQKISVILT